MQKTRKKHFGYTIVEMNIKYFLYYIVVRQMNNLHICKKCNFLT